MILKEGFKLVNENNDNFDIYQSLFKRYIYCFDSLNLFLEDFDEAKMHRAQSIAIILRASLLDYLTTLYLLTFQRAKSGSYPNGKNEYRNAIMKLQSEQIRRFLTISENDKKSSTFDRNEFKNTVNTCYNTFGYLFNSEKPLDYNNPSKSLIYNASDDIKPSVILKRLNSFAVKSINLKYQEVYELYDIYSKYDHFGTTSMALEHSTVNEFCESMFWSIFHITDAISICTNLLKDETGSKSNFENLFKEIDSLRGTIHTRHLYLSDSYKQLHR